MSETTCGYRLKELEKEVAALEGQRAAIQAECDEPPSMPTDSLLAGLKRSIRGAAEEDGTQKLKELLACVVDEIVVESRERITPYYSLPAVRPLFPQRMRKEYCKNPNALGQPMWVDGRNWGRVA